MKKVIAFLAGVLFSVLLISLAAAWENPWKEGMPAKDSSFRRTFHADIKGGHCSVGVRKDGSGVFLVGIDYDWFGTAVFHTIDVSYKEVKKSLKEAMWEYEIVGEDENISAKKKEGGYRVFDRCWWLADELPEDVKKEFRGHGGVK